MYLDVQSDEPLDGSSEPSELVLGRLGEGRGSDDPEVTRGELDGG